MGGICRIQGRIEDYILCKDGTKVMRLDFIFKEAQNIKTAQLVQKQVGKVLIKVVPENGFTASNASDVIDRLIDRTGKDNLDVSLEITTMKGLIYSRSGKFKYIVSLI